MGFLRFLGKKDAAKDVDLNKEIDLPPLPSSFNSDLPDFSMPKDEPRGPQPMFPKPIEEKEMRMPLPPLEPMPFPGIMPPPMPKHPLEDDMPKPISTMPMPVPVHKEHFMPKTAPMMHPKPVMHHELHHEMMHRAPAVHMGHVIRDGALFIKMEQYRDFMYDINLIQESLKKIDSMMKKVNSVRNEEDAAIDEWHKLVEDLSKKIILVDKAMAR